MTILRKTISNEALVPEIARLIDEGMEVTFKPKGSSMLPFIRGDRDSVILKKVSDLKPGHIVLAKTDDSRYVIHRIERIEGDRLTLMGDGNIAGRETCRLGDVMGTAVRIVRNGKEVDCLSVSHLRMASVWRRLLPVRRYLLAIYRRIIL